MPLNLVNAFRLSEPPGCAWRAAWYVTPGTSSFRYSRSTLEKYCVAESTVDLSIPLYPYQLQGGVGSHRLSPPLSISMSHRYNLVAIRETARDPNQHGPVIWHDRSRRQNVRVRAISALATSDTAHL